MSTLTEYQRQHIIELLERGRELPHAALGGQRSKAPRVISSPERDFALFDTEVQCCAFRPPAPVGVRKAGRRSFVRERQSGIIGAGHHPRQHRRARWMRR